MKRPLILALAAGATLLAAGSAQASDVRWSIGIGLPPVATVVSNGPVYGAVYDPVPFYAPAPVYAAPPVVYRGWHRPHYVYERPIVVYRGHEGRWYDGRRGDDRGHDGRGHDDHRRWHH
jgi:hypothetical protein